jgi:hypothetical protein
VRKITDTIYLALATFCLLIAGVATLKHFGHAPASIDGTRMWQAWALVGLSSVFLRIADALALLGLFVVAGARRLLRHAGSSLPWATLARAGGLLIAGGAYACAFAAPLVFFLMLDQFEHIANAPPI